MISKEFGIAVRDQSILHRGKLLIDNRTLFDCGIRSSPKEESNFVLVITKSGKGLLADAKKVKFHWDPARTGSKLSLNAERTTLKLSHGSWQTAQGNVVFQPNSGKYFWEYKFSILNIKKNTFAAVIGIVPDGPYLGRINQPIGWQKVAGWGFIVGLGQILHDGRTSTYIKSKGAPAVKEGERIGLLLDTDNGTLTFFLNGKSLGVAFDSVNIRVRPAISCIQTQEASLVVDNESVHSSSQEQWPPEPELKEHRVISADGFGWKVPGRSSVKLNPSRTHVKCAHSGWTSLEGDQIYKPGTGLHTWEIVLTRIDAEKNVFGCVVGIVPVDAGTGVANQPIGWKKIPGWGLVIGTGQLLHQSTGQPYPSKDLGDVKLLSFKSGDVVGIALDMDKGTLSFFKNGRDLGEAFTGIYSSVRPALSCIQTQETKLRCPASFHNRLSLASSLEDYKVLNGKGSSNVDGFRWEKPSRKPETVSSDGKGTTWNHSTWRTFRGDIVLHPKSGVHEWEITLTALSLRQNNFGVVIGIIPADNTGAVSSNQPVGWKSVPGWSIVAGTGQKLHQSGAIPYVTSETRGGKSFRRGQRVGVRLDTDVGTLEFFRNGVPLGVAFNGICVPVRPALSCIQKQSTLLHHPLSKPLKSAEASHKKELKNGVHQQWFRWKMMPSINLARKGKERMATISADGCEVVTRNAVWQTVRGDSMIKLNSGRHFWVVFLKKLRLDSNTFGIVVGAIPAQNQSQPAINQPIGWKTVPGWGLVAGNGDILHRSAGEHYMKRGGEDGWNVSAFKEGDVLGILVDSDVGTIEYFRNGKSLGIAFSGISVPVYPAMSLIGTQTARLMFRNTENIPKASTEKRTNKFSSKKMRTELGEYISDRKSGWTKEGKHKTNLSQAVTLRISGGTWKTTLGASTMVYGKEEAYEWDVDVEKLDTSKNTFAIVIGVMSSSMLGKVNQPVGWRSARGWAIVAGTGKRLHDSKSSAFCPAFRSRCRITVKYDGRFGSLSFSKDGRIIGKAFTGIKDDVYPAISVIQSQELSLSPIRCLKSAKNKATSRYYETNTVGWGGFGWDKALRGRAIEELENRVVTASGSSWQTVIGDRIFNEGTGVHTWAIEVESLDVTKNIFGAVIGVIPSDFNPRSPSSSQPVGWQRMPGWALILSQGRLLQNGKSRSYGFDTSIREGDVLGVRLDTNRKTLRFYKNRIPCSTSPAFTSLSFPLRAAASVVQRQRIKLISPYSLPVLKIVSESDQEVEVDAPDIDVSASGRNGSRRSKRRGRQGESEASPTDRVDVIDNTKSKKREKKVYQEDKGMVEVRRLLEGLGLMEYYERFKSEHVTYETLKSLDLDDLREIVPKFGHRAQIRNRVKLLVAEETKKSSSPPPGKTNRKKNNDEVEESGNNVGSRKSMGLEIYRRVLSTVVSGMYMNRGQLEQLNQIQKEYALPTGSIEKIMREVGASHEDIKEKLARSEALKAAPAAGKADAVGGAGEASMMEEDPEEEEPPDAYLCPITTELMTDPVVAEDGKTYERSAIAMW
eukprot:CAMPEP_0167746948 /NCGR_PEP_ID=MMETSP0110_2-20121227/3999_1 /TAXON_ID=629695 /ORGANISM="Gymnochlora sp., Strain CCMP2014" /LENGTH=1524 /DNA_ID=CAMNT_0007631775 /DNA_START=213 /DNA_END=4784 /DNA_ORIENTATION=+